MCRSLDRGEVKDCLLMLEMWTTEEDFNELFDFLDADKSGDVDWEEFKVVAQHAASTNAVLDYIPLHEIKSVDFELHPRDTKRTPFPQKKIERHNEQAIKPNAGRVDRAVTNHKGFLSALVSGFEAYTGIDVDGDGQSDNILVPPYDAGETEVHLVVSTVEKGHNSGRVYIHVLPNDDVQNWLDNLTHWTKEAKRRKLTQDIIDAHGHSGFSMMRAKTKRVYNSVTFSCLMAALILFGFLLDIADSQILPEPGTPEESMFYWIDVVVTVLFTLELLINLLAHSEECFRPFYINKTNWFVFVFAPHSNPEP